MKLTVLGNNGPFPGAGGACSGYLLQEGEINLLFDCGNGVLSNLQRVISFDKLDAIILSHLHNDHMADMLVLQYALDIKIKKGAISKPLRLYAPPQPGEVYNKLDIPGVFDITPVSTDLMLEFGGLKVSFKEMKHPVQCFGVAVSNGSSRLVYSGDTSWNQEIIEFARGADLLMLDAGLLACDKTNDNVPHLTAEECGIIAREAGAGELILTHFWPEYDRMELLSEARRSFDKTILSELLQSYEV